MPEKIELAKSQLIDNRGETSKQSLADEAWDFMKENKAPLIAAAVVGSAAVGIVGMRALASRMAAKEAVPELQIGSDLLNLQTSKPSVTTISEADLFAKTKPVRDNAFFALKPGGLDSVSMHEVPHGVVELSTLKIPPLREPGLMHEYIGNMNARTALERLQVPEHLRPIGQH